jgi:hypothetical protein
MPYTCPKCEKPMQYAPEKPKFEGAGKKATAVTGKIPLVCPDPKCGRRGTADLDDMRRQLREATASHNTAAANAIRDEIRRLGFDP